MAYLVTIDQGGPGLAGDELPGDIFSGGIR
jgi:hypothetical protein